MEVITNLARKASQNPYEVKQNDNALYIEGFANKAVIDRGNELIPGEEWNIENYKKNNVVLYQHGKDTRIGTLPIGEVVKLKTDSNGLKVKARIIDPGDNSDFKFIHKLIRNGILKTFSVGFNPKDSEVDGEGVKILKGVELLEVSVVNIPMNQDSTFELATKDYSTPKGKELVKDFISNLVFKGAWVAAAIHNQIYELQQKDEEFDREKALETIADMAKTTVDEIKKILAGDVQDIPENILEAISEVLGLAKDDLLKLKEKQEENADEEENEEESNEGEKKPKVEDEEESSEEDDGEDQEEMGEDEEDEEDENSVKPKKGLLAELIKTKADEKGLTNEQLAKAANVSLSAISQLLNGKIRKPKKERLKALSKLLGVSMDEFKKCIETDRENEAQKAKLEGEAFQRCVEEKIPILIREGKKRDEAVAQAISMCREKGNCELTPALLQMALDVSANVKQELPPQPIGETSTEDTISTPQLDSAKQANVFLGQIVAEQQKTNALLTELINNMSGRIVQPQEEENIGEEEGNLILSNPITSTKEKDEKDNDNQIVDIVKKYQEDINNRLSKLGFLKNK